MTPSARTLKYYRDLGYIVARVERDMRIPPREPGGKPMIYKQDLWGFGDYLAFKEGQPGVIIIQSTVMGEQARHVAKIEAEPNARKWSTTGNPIHLISWRTLKVNGKPKWTPAIIVFGRDLTKLELAP